MLHCLSSLSKHTCMFVCFCISLIALCSCFTPWIAHLPWTQHSPNHWGFFCLTLTRHIWSRIGDFWNLRRLVKLLVCTCKKCFTVTSLSGFGPWWFGLVWSLLLFPNPDWSTPPLFSPKHTRIQTTAMTHHSNNSVRDHMKWVSGSLLISRITAMMPVHFSVPPIIPPHSPSPDSLPVWGVP